MFITALITINKMLYSKPEFLNLGGSANDHKKINNFRCKIKELNHSDSMKQGVSAPTSLHQTLMHQNYITNKSTMLQCIQ